MSRRYYTIIIILLWLVLVGRLVQTTYFQGAGSYISLETGLKELPDESEWMNIYHDGKKMGYAVSTIENRGAEGYKVKSSSHLNLVFGGLSSEVHLESSAIIDTLFMLQSFTFWMQSEQYSTNVEGEKMGTTMTLKFIQGSDTSVTSLQVPEDLYTYSAIQPMVASKGIEAGQTIKVPAYDPMSNEMADVFVTHEGKEILEIAGEGMILNKLKIEFKGIPSILYLDDNGLTYREETIMGMTMERTTPDEALAEIQAPEVDLLSGFSIKPDPPIRNAAHLEGLELEISGIEAASFVAIQSNRQKVISTDPLRIELSKATTRIADPGNARYLRSTEMIQSKHPEIIRTLPRIFKNSNVGGESKVLTKWVFDYLEKRPVASISGAVDILHQGVGDCTEHTTLFTSLSRAKGIPTKIHIGLVHIQGRFLFHAWPVVAIDGEWVDVDPSLNQYPADATHIALLEGDFENLSNLIPALGNIDIKVISQKY